jgi:GNAT superfamily N-acetyltransferase
MASVRVRIRPTWDAIDDATLRPIAEADLGFLWDMLYEAAAATPGIRYLPRSEALGLPVVFRHLAGWGRAGDGGVVALVDGVRAGAAWYRVFAPRDRGAGIVAWPGLLEATVAVDPRLRRRGLGNALLTAMVESARAAGFHRVALAVGADNPVRHLCERCGFHEVGTDDPGVGAARLLVAEVA